MPRDHNQSTLKYALKQTKATLKRWFVGQKVIQLDFRAEKALCTLHVEGERQVSSV